MTALSRNPHFHDLRHRKSTPRQDAWKALARRDAGKGKRRSESEEEALGTKMTGVGSLDLGGNVR